MFVNFRFHLFLTGNVICHVALFLIYITDLDRKVKINAKVFADDTSLLSTVAKPKTSANNFNN